jgi:hypothetical protein
MKTRKTTHTSLLANLSVAVAVLFGAARPTAGESNYGPRIVLHHGTYYDTLYDGVFEGVVHIGWELSQDITRFYYASGPLIAKFVETKYYNPMEGHDLRYGFHTTRATTYYYVHVTSYTWLEYFGSNPPAPRYLDPPGFIDQDPWKGTLTHIEPDQTQKDVTTNDPYWRAFAGSNGSEYYIWWTIQDIGTGITTLVQQRVSINPGAYLDVSPPLNGWVLSVSIEEK